jgi:hypothetical protein
MSTDKLVHLPGTLLTPNVVLHRTLEKLDHVKGVIVIIQWKDNTMAVDWSSFALSELAMASMVLDNMTRTALFKKD